MSFETVAVIVLAAVAATPLVLAWIWPRVMLWVAAVGGGVAGIRLVVEALSPREDQPIVGFMTHDDGSGSWDLGLDVWLSWGVLAVAAVTLVVVALRRWVIRPRATV